METFKLPDLGEGLQEAEVIEWQIEAGEEVAVDQVIVVVETAKAIVEIPSPVAGRVAKLCAKAGETVKVGQVLVEYEQEAVSVTTTEQKPKVESSSESVSVVGVLSNSEEGVVDQEEFIVGPGCAEKGTENTTNPRTHQFVPPDLLAFARQLGLEGDLESMDISSLSKAKLAELYEKKSVDAANVSSIEEDAQHPIIPLKGTKKIMAQAMMKSHQQVPAVTLFDDAHVGHWQNEDVTVRVIEAMIEACKTVPVLNAWFDDESLSIQTFSDINIGVAVNSDDGLFVPVVKDAQKLSSQTMRTLVNKMIADVKKRSIKPQKLMGATISLSNFGTLSGRYATPIIVPPQVAIVGIGKLRDEAVVKSGELAVERVMPVSLSFDHRAATGAEAAKFLSVLIENLQR